MAPHSIRYGAAIVLFAAFLFSIMGLGIRLGRDNFRADNLVFYRSLIQALLLLPWLHGIIRNRSTDRMRFHLYRGLFGILSMVAVYSALQRLPLALATLLSMTGVAWSTLFAAVFLGELTTRRQVYGGLIAISGLILVVIPAGGGGFWSNDLLGISLGLIGGLLMGAAHTLIRKLRVDDISMPEIVFYFSVTGMVLTLPGLMSHPQFPTTQFDWLTLFIVGVIGSLGQMLMTTGFKYTPTAVASLCILSQTPINVILGAIWLGEYPPALFYVGMVLVFLGIFRVVR